MSRDVITYGPATLAALERELAEPITSPIANPAPIGHGLVMDDEEHAEAMMDRLMAANAQTATSKRVLFDAARSVSASLRTLAANLRDAGALWLAHTGIDDADGGKWWPGCGRAAPGWER